MSTLTDREREIIVLAWQCFKSQPAVSSHPDPYLELIQHDSDYAFLMVNYKKLADLGGFKNTASANSSYCPAKKKMLSAVPTNLTDREREILVMAWQCFKTPVEVRNSLCSICSALPYRSFPDALIGIG